MTIPFAFKPAWALVAERQNESLLLNDSQKAILEALKKNPHLTGDQLAKETNLSLSSIKKGMVRLQESGLIERSGSKRFGYWIVR